MKNHTDLETNNSALALNRRDTLALLSLLQFSPLAAAQIPQRGAERKITVLLETEVPPIADPLVWVQLVEVPPGGKGTQPHRHPGPVFGYILEGDLRFQVQSGPPVTYRPGQVFHERAGDIHIVSDNPSADQWTRFLVVILGHKGQPPTIPL